MLVLILLKTALYQKHYFKHILLSYKTRQMDKTQVVNIKRLEPARSEYPTEIHKR
jgi:hypothetical protein